MIIFYNEGHEQAYKYMCARMQSRDVYHRALAYLLALDEVTRAHMDDIFDADNDAINIAVLHAPWQTGTSICTTRLALNLWNGYSGEEDENRNYYTPEYIFSRREYARYYWQAIKLRFEIA